MGKKHYEILVQGKVQGIGFRYRVKEFADAKDLRGYARNLHDGTVEIVVEGTEFFLTDCIKWLKSNPSSSDVQQIDFKVKEIEGYREFRIF